MNTGEGRRERGKGDERGEEIGGRGQRRGKMEKRKGEIKEEKVKEWN